jgi:hypothetical protein
MNDTYPNAHMVHLPVHASWLNQVEIYFSVLQRKALTSARRNPRLIRAWVVVGALGSSPASGAEWIPAGHDAYGFPSRIDESSDDESGITW